MPVKIQNSFSPVSPVGEALNNAITTYANSIPTYGEVQEGRVNANKADAPVEMADKIRALYGASGGEGRPLTPQMVQDQIAGLAEATAKGGDVGKLGDLLRVVVANAANPESVQMIDRAQQGAGQAYNTTETGFNINENNDIRKTQMQQDGANYRARVGADAMRAKMAGTNPVTGQYDGLTPTMRMAKENQVKGKSQVSDILQTMDGLYTTLDKGGEFTDADGVTHTSSGGGVTSLNNGVIENLIASTASGPAGQYIGKKIGTNNQSLRNEIAAKVPLIKQAVMSATGMSAKQMDSNVEMKAFMQALTDPTNDVQSSRNTLRFLDKLYGTGALAGASNPAPTPGAAPTVENSGDVVDPGAAGDGAIYDDVTGKSYRLGDDGQYYEE